MKLTRIVSLALALCVAVSSAVASDVYYSRTRSDTVARAGDLVVSFYAVEVVEADATHGAPFVAIQRYCLGAYVHEPDGSRYESELSIDWGDGIEARARGGEPWMCHDYSPSLVPYVLEAKVRNGGDVVTFRDVYPSDALRDPCGEPTPSATPREVRSTCEQVPLPHEWPQKICDVLRSQGSRGIWWEGDCLWALSEPVSWATAVALWSVDRFT